ncbi:MAG: hypothetical protein A3G18_07095 [Rhodospirillales bacterium RIFCSPLOWO2_12_FULL_58_28]|nr:MAG: hypothetical protein A3H92_11795 [Rhodospirillales bacterium RIFCSPLOWO2_02_FULL_58_16]OHC78639.1 MAG: hypothetical protein A3G18_07095 [Rhodospirillales bacterium RIFCSPLOWO2_12_FULL_58_28]
MERLNNWSSSRGDPSTLFIVSLGSLPTQLAGDDFWLDLNKVLLVLKTRYGASIYELSCNERAVFIKTTEMSRIGIVSDLKLDLLRLIQEHLPDHFGLVDQSRLLRAIDLAIKRQNAIQFLERCRDQEAKGSREQAKLRRLHHNDIARVEELYKKIGDRDFSRAFVHGQRIAVINPCGPAKSFMKECFVKMDILKKHVFSDVELRGSGNVFNQLTISLDRFLLGGFEHINPNGLKCSINVNVETVFTYAFKAFLEKTPPEIFANIVFEFRQDNILQHFDQFEIACNLIASRNGSVAVDAIFPETVGIVNLSRLRINMAKIFWRQGADVSLDKCREYIKSLLDSGTMIALARVDDEAGITLGHSLGISLFQGFYIDSILPKES